MIFNTILKSVAHLIWFISSHIIVHIILFQEEQNKQTNKQT